MTRPPTRPGRARTRHARAWALVAACLCLEACEVDFGFKMDAGLAQWALDGDVALEPSGGGASLPDIENDYGDSLGFEDWRTSPYIRIAAETGGTTLSLSTLFYSENASGRLQNGFGDIPAGELVQSTVDMASIRLSLHKKVFERRDFTISPGVGIHYLDMDVRARSLAGLEQRVDAELPMPSIYVKMAYPFGDFVGEVDVGFGGIVLPHDAATVGDLEAVLRWHPVPLVELFAGYRFVLYDIEGESDAKAYSTDFLLHGWLIGFKIGP